MYIPVLEVTYENAHCNVIIGGMCILIMGHINPGCTLIEDDSNLGCIIIEGALHLRVHYNRGCIAFEGAF